MAKNNSSSSSSTLRFLQILKQPGSVSFTQIRNPDPVEFHESDVVWSFSAVSPDSNYSYQILTSPSSPAHNNGRRFNPAKSGLSAALSDENNHLIRRKSTVNAKIIPAAKRQDDIQAKFHQSAPVNIPVWPKHRNTDLKRFHAVDDDDDDDDDDGGIGEEEMVPPHVIVARSHVTFSVFEGAGRTLKGRDLRRVRNAVFQKTGFID